MIHDFPPTKDSGAIISVSRQYRYVLWRIWNGENRPSLKMIAFVGLNPSTADEQTDDPTIRRCIGFATDWGYDGIYMINLWAFRATEPKVLKEQTVKEAEGPQNRDWLVKVAERSISVVLAWGSHGNWRGQGKKIFELVADTVEPFSFGQNAGGEPKHPLYLRKDTPCKPFEGYADAAKGT